MEESPSGVRLEKSWAMSFLRGEAAARYNSRVSRPFQFGLLQLFGLMAVAAIVSWLIGCCSRDPGHAPAYAVFAFLVLGIGGGELTGDVLRGVRVASIGFIVLLVAAIMWALVTHP